MIIHLHWLEYSALPLTDIDLEQIVSMTGIPLSLFNSYTTKNGTRVFTYSVPDAGGEESVAISIPQTAYGTVKFRGSFFDYYPDFPVHTFRDFMQTKGGNPLRLDVSFVDDSGCIDFQEYKRMSDISCYRDYLAGSSVISRKKRRKFNDKPDSGNRQGIPDVHANHQLIHYGDTGGNYSKLYVRGDGQAKFEITLVDKQHGQTLLDAFNPDTISEFEALAKQALVKSINFVTPASKKAKRTVQVESYRRFLGSPVKPIKWTDHAPEIDIAAETFDEGLSRIIARIQGHYAKHGILAELSGDIDALEAKSRKVWEATHSPLPAW